MKGNGLLRKFCVDSFDAIRATDLYIIRNQMKSFSPPKLVFVLSEG